MKKEYIKPELTCNEVLCKQMLLGASNHAVLNSGDATINEGSYQNETKRNDYNVWSDDWSQ